MIKHVQFCLILLFISSPATVFAEPSSETTETDIFSDSQCQWHHPQQSSNNISAQILESHQSLPELTNATIKSITLVRENIFDTSNPKEDNALFKLANKLNVMTKEHVIRQQLLFTEGDIYDRQKVIESERLLRNAHYLYDAHIRVERDCDDQVSIVITTKELWTLTPEINFSRSGGENKSRFGFRDTNLFGTGKRISISKRSDKDRSGYTFIYDDPNVLGSRYQSSLELSDNDDGERYYVDFKLPFYALATPQSYGAVSFKDTRNTPLYYRGEVLSEFSHKTRINQVFYGQGEFKNNWTRRWQIGLQDELHDFNAIPETTLPIAEKRQLTYPWISYHWLENNYVTLANFDSIGRTEDLNLGWNIFTRFGYSDKQLSNDDSRFIFESSIQKAFQYNDNQLWRWYSSLYGYWNTSQSQTENLFFDTSLKLHHNSSLKEAWFANFEMSLAGNMTHDKQLTLGGDTGLRGYPVQYQVGNRRFLVNLEKRYYSEYHLFQLFKVGGAAFFDLGRAWYHNRDNGENGKTLKNIGIGLRLAPSRATAKTVIHIDFAVPLDKANDTDSVQWLMTVKNAF